MQRNRLSFWLQTARKLAKVPTTDGGPGSGNWGHRGRPGLVGGSGKGGGSQYRGGRSDIAYVSSKRDWLNGLSGERQKAASGFVKSMRSIFNVGNGGSVEKAIMESTAARAPKLRSELLGYMSEARNWDQNAKRLMESNLSETERKIVADLAKKHGSAEIGGATVPDDSNEKDWDAEDLRVWQDLKSKAMGGETSGKEIQLKSGRHTDSSQWSDATKELIAKKMRIYGNEETDPDKFLVNLINSNTQRRTKDEILKAIGNDLGWQEIGKSREFKNLDPQEAKDLTYLMDQFPWLPDNPKFAKVFSDDEIRDGTSSGIHQYYLRLKAKELGIAGIQTGKRPKQLEMAMDHPESKDPLRDTKGIEHTVTEAGNAHRNAIRQHMNDHSDRIFYGASDEEKQTILKSVDTMDDNLAELVSRTIGNVSVMWNMTPETSHYRSGSGVITLNNVSRGAETFWHEYGHYLDDTYSSKADMEYALYPLWSDSPDVRHGATSLSNASDALTNAAKSDIEGLLKQLGIEGMTVEINNSAHGGKLNLKKDGMWINPRVSGTGLQCMDLSDALYKRMQEWSGKQEAYDYMKNHGEPQHPEFKDYFETYITPKRKLTRTREKYKGAEEAYREASERYWREHDEWEERLGPEKLGQMRAEAARLSERAERRMQLAASITDCIDESVQGSFMCVVLLGGHEADYYMSRGRVETTANMFQMLAMGDPDQIDCVKTFLPATYELYTRAWRYRGTAKQGTTDSLDGGPGSGNFGHQGRPGMVGGSGPGGGQGGRNIDGVWSHQGTYEEASSRREFIHRNVKALKANGYGPKEATAVFEGTMMKRAAESAHQVSDEEAILTARAGIPDSWRQGWFLEYNSEYKPKIEDAILGDPDVLNAGWNIAYRDYMETVGEGSGRTFEEFLTTPIQMYRGTNGQQEIASDVWSSFSMDRRIAEKFGKHIETITIRPIDTWGSFQTTGEAEVLVPRTILTKMRGG